MWNPNRHGQSRLFWPFVVVTIGACGYPDDRTTSSKDRRGKLSVATRSAKPVEPSLRWGYAMTAKVAMQSDQRPMVSALGANSGNLSPEDERLEDGSHFDEWLYRATADEELEISVRSDSFDTYLMVLEGESGMGLLAADDDGGGDLNSAVTVRFPTDGAYSIVVTSYSPDELGDYSLVLRRPDSSGSTTPVLMAGSTIQSRLAASDPLLGDGTHYRSWSYHGTARERLVVEMESEDFDTFLIFGRGRLGSSFEWLAEDDDGGSGSNSRLSVTLPDDGTYTIVANSFDVGEGAFELVVESESPAVQRAAYPGSGDPTERYALLVGIDDYPGTDSDLQGPRGDVAMMHDLLVSTYGFTHENIVTLLDQEATRNGIAQAFSAHLGQAGSDGVAVFFYSGHGTRLGDNRGIGHPVDAEEDGVDEALVVWGESGAMTLILDDELGLMADNLRTPRTLLIVDACFSGTASRGGSASAGQPKLMPLALLTNLRYPRHILGAASVLPAFPMPQGSKAVTAIDRTWRPERHVLLAASSEDEVAWTAGLMPGWSEPVSVFTYFLYQTLVDQGSNATFDSVHADLVEAVANRQRAHELPRQTPQVAGEASGQTVRQFLSKR